MAELLDVLSRDKFASRFQAAGLVPLTIVKDLHRIAHMTNPVSVPRVVASDPDDDHVLACAVSSQADLIVSGDKHLLGLGNSYSGISIVRPQQALTLLGIL
jgi:uncharacterized protein